ncbi:MAG: hypothetical protein V3V08_03580 [Nannocystaceae bacterium]
MCRLVLPCLLALTATTLYGACRVLGVRTPQPSSTSTLDPTRPTVGVVCSQTCTRYSACNEENSRTALADPPAFVFDCSPTCKQASAVSSPQTAKLLDCVDLQDCRAFLSCVGVVEPDPSGPGTPPESANASVTYAPSDPCERICRRARACEDSEGEGEGEGDSACLADCQRGPPRNAERNAVLACAKQPTCDALVPCLSATPEENDPAHAVARVGIAGMCTQLCDRTLACGAHDSELSPRQLRALSRDTDDLWMECAIQCGQELREDNRSHFVDCVARHACEDFLACAEKL